MDAFKDAAIKFTAGRTLTIEERDTLADGLMLHTLEPEEVTEAVLLGLSDPSASARIKMIERAKKLVDLPSSVLHRVEELAGDELCPGDRHPGVRQAAKATLKAHAARQA